MLSVSTLLLAEELKKRGYDIELFDSRFLLRAKKGTTAFLLYGSKGPQISAASYLLCMDKYLSRQLMVKDHFAIPRFATITYATIGNLADFQFPVVIKPLTLSGGKDVVVGVTSSDEVYTYLQSHPQYESVLVEELLQGDDTRVLIVQGKFFAASQRIPPTITGDGVHSIQGLVDSENARRQRLIENDEKEQRYTTSLLPILFDSEAIRVIDEQGCIPTTVLEKGKQVHLRKNANVSTGGTTVDVTDLVCPQIRQECERLAESLNISVVGVDIMTTDLSRPLASAQKSGIVEVNASPGLDLHALVDEGQRRDPTPLIVDDIEQFLSR